MERSSSGRDYLEYLLSQENLISMFSTPFGKIDAGGILLQNLNYMSVCTSLG